jgi:hypothetical protein
MPNWGKKWFKDSNVYSLTVLLSLKTQSQETVAVVNSTFPHNYQRLKGDHDSFSFTDS